MLTAQQLKQIELAIDLGCADGFIDSQNIITIVKKILANYLETPTQQQYSPMLGYRLQAQANSSGLITTDYGYDEFGNKRTEPAGEFKL